MTFTVLIRENGAFRSVSFQTSSFAKALQIKKALGGFSLTGRMS